MTDDGVLYKSKKPYRESIQASGEEYKGEVWALEVDAYIVWRKEYDERVAAGEATSRWVSMPQPLLHERYRKLCPRKI